MADKTSDAVSRLLSSAEPGVRLLARRDLLGEDVVDTDKVLEGALVRTLLSGQCRDGGFGVHPYRKWAGAHWRLVSLVELGIPASEQRALRAADTVLDWLTGQQHRSSVVTVDGLVRCHASRKCSRGVLATRARSRPPGGVAGRLAHALAMARWWVELRYPSRRTTVVLPRVARPGMGIVRVLAGDRANRCTWGGLPYCRVVPRTPAFRVLRTGRVIRREWLALHYPLYWHDDILRALLVLSRMQLTSEPRCSDALALLN
jgi:hypothetical protein